MTVPDFKISSYVAQLNMSPCFHCHEPMDLLSAELCDCIARERTFKCLHCGSCACDASYRERNEFWLTAPPSLWDRRREETKHGVARLQSLDPKALPRPLALIVDDETLVLSVADHALRELGFTTLITTNAEEAYAVATATVPDLLLTDALMPRLDGRELCLRLKNSEPTRHMKVIVMSGLYRHVAYRYEAFKAFHVDEYLQKPVKPAALREAVARLLPELVSTLPHAGDARKAS